MASSSDNATMAATTHLGEEVDPQDSAKFLRYSSEERLARQPLLTKLKGTATGDRYLRAQRSYLEGCDLLDTCGLPTPNFAELYRHYGSGSGTKGKKGAPGQGAKGGSSGKQGGKQEDGAGLEKALEEKLKIGKAEACKMAVEKVGEAILNDVRGFNPDMELVSRLLLACQELLQDDPNHFYARVVSAFMHQISLSCSALGEVGAGSSSTQSLMESLALQDLQAAVKLRPEDPRTHKLLGQAYMKMGNYGKAVDTLEAAVKAAGKLPSGDARCDGICGCHYTIGNILWSTTPSPGQPLSSAERQRARAQVIRSLEHMQKFVDQAPNDHPQVASACFILTFGWLNLKAGSQGTKMGQIFAQNSADVKRSIELYQRGLEAQAILRSWGPPIPKGRTEEVHAKFVMDKLVEEGLLDVVPRLRTACWRDNCDATEQPGQPVFKICGGCRHAKYCSVECQRADWKSHKLACPILAERKAMAKAVPPEPAPGKQ